jgi:putative hemolysin
LGSSVGIEFLIVLLLIVINGVFAMAEIAVVSARKSRLQQRAEGGDEKARRALELAEHPNRFLSTVQIGITLVGILAGAYGGATLARQLDDYLEHFAPIARYSEEISLTAVVAAITYLSLVVGELVPKRIGLNHPERIASLVAGPMHMLSMVASPLVKLLSASTEGLLRLLGIRKAEEPPVTEEEIAALLEAGAEAGVFEEEEHELVERVFWLGDQRAESLMTPRHKIVWLDLEDPPEVHRETIRTHRFSRFLVCQGAVDRVVGMARAMDLLTELLEGGPLDIREVLRKPLIVPEGMRALRLLELFRESGIHLAVVVDEYGGVEGIVTLHDVLEEISGDLNAGTETRVVQREDGSWLVDATLTMDEFWECLELEERRAEGRQEYHTLGGFVVTTLGHIPRAGESFEAHGLRFEVVDMDANRVDKVLVSLSRSDGKPNP